MVGTFEKSLSPGHWSQVELPANVTPEQMALLMDDAMDGMMSEMDTWRGSRWPKGAITGVALP